MSEQIKKIFKILRPYILAVLFMLLPLILNLNTFLPRLLPELKSSKPAIAMIVGAHGDTSFRNAFDTIWLPASPNSQLYSGDYVRTGYGAGAKIILINSNPLPVSPDSEHKPPIEDALNFSAETFAKISLEHGTFKIKLINGDIQTAIASSNVNVIIEKGDQVEAVTPNKVEPTVAPAVPLEPEKKEEQKPTPQPPSEPKPKTLAKDTEEKILTEEEMLEAVKKKTIPRIGVILLFLKDQNFTYRFPVRCVQTCTLKIWHKENIVTDLSFKNKDEISTSLPADTKRFGPYKWQVSTNGKTYDGHFSFLAYTSENVARSMKEKLSVEVNF